MSYGQINPATYTLAVLGGTFNLYRDTRFSILLPLSVVAAGIAVIIYAIASGDKHVDSAGLVVFAATAITLLLWYKEYYKLLIVSVLFTLAGYSLLEYLIDDNKCKTKQDFFDRSLEMIFRGGCGSTEGDGLATRDLLWPVTLFILILFLSQLYLVVRQYI